MKAASEIRLGSNPITDPLEIFAASHSSGAGTPSFPIQAQNAISMLLSFTTFRIINTIRISYTYLEASKSIKSSLVAEMLEGDTGHQSTIMLAPLLQ